MAIGEDIDCGRVQLQLGDECMNATKLASEDIMERCRETVCLQAHYKDIMNGLFRGEDGACIEGPHEPHDPTCVVHDASKCPPHFGQSICVSAANPAIAPAPVVV
eukprot:CAMPEP_0115489662 /NCGR_PEP_ID=MMETSP0271-20121206/62140_1 /TAXON_ID=71861 /ORGANISM="Scrippsiella trochoidea, Strain CCMP3099" /LENGTH=104 /DNA_ID=CAMNT_0002917857 /DNA_START=177 /DNA_END=491 /DNA_ORIENTATION=+